MNDHNVSGRVILDLSSTKIKKNEIARLTHPECAGVILFTRNYETPEQLIRLINQIRNVRHDLLICVDQEGGRVQRFREGFLELPPLRSLGEAYDHNIDQALRTAETLAWLMASECLSAGIDFSFAPVLDLDYGNSEVIGDRAFHSQPDAIIALATAYIKGLHSAGMVAIGKHYPGHGYTCADSHTSLPVDDRSFQEIFDSDLRPFKALGKSGIDGIMPAHVIYQQCDTQPAGFSEYWIKEVLRSQCQYKGVIFSDDLSMAGAISVGTPAERAKAALKAGCDILIVCNDPEAADEVLDSIAGHPASNGKEKIKQLKGRSDTTWDLLHASKLWKEKVTYCKETGFI